MGIDKKLAKKSREIDIKNKIGRELDFAASEAYKQLRTNIEFTLADSENCRVFGVTSSVPHEGKSLTTLNLAISFSDMKKRTLLIECDMRKPVLEKYFKLEKSVGLADVLAGFASLRDCLRKAPEYPNFYMISAGSIPPNPAELLSSNRMEEMMKKLSEQFDVIILDLPPVTVVADATIVSKVTQGMLIVVRDDYVEKADLAETIRQFKMANVKILGLVYNAQMSGNSKYYKNKYNGYKYDSYDTKN